jgi:protein arginine kinase activator
MLCCVCQQKQATVHLTQILGDDIRKIDLCEDCANRKGVNNPTALPMTALLAMLDPQPNPRPPGRRTEL